MNADRPLGPSRLVEAIQERAARPLRGVALFATAGTVAASVTAMNPMLSGRRQVAGVAARAARSGLPQVVGLAVDAEGVDVYPLTWDGQVTGDAVTRWNKGGYSARTLRRVLVIQLAITVGGGQHLTLETKTFPFGVNRHNAAIARMIVALGTKP